MGFTNDGPVEFRLQHVGVYHSPVKAFNPESWTSQAGKTIAATALGYDAEQHMVRLKLHVLLPHPPPWFSKLGWLQESGPDPIP